ncbi:MAG: DHH family phosphoesterase [Tepidisphaerales bacterium]
MARRLGQLRRPLLTTHVRPDGDALGSVAALALAYRDAGVPADILLLSRLPNKYAFVLTDAGLRCRDASAEGWPELGGYDAVVVADTGTFSQLPGLSERLAAPGGGGPGSVLVIDHHRTQESWGTMRLVDVSAAATTELLARVLRSWGVALSPPLATALYVGLATDTGWFAFSNTTPSAMRLAADLMEAGVDADAIYRRLFQSEREPRLRLQARVMNSLELRCGGRLAVMTATADDFLATGATVPDTENLINFPLALGSVEMALLVTESPPPEDDTVKVSCRSKGAVDVAKFAEQFGGGGHARASGLKLPGPLEQARERVVAAAEAQLAAAAAGCVGAGDGRM